MEHTIIPQIISTTLKNKQSYAMIMPVLREIKKTIPTNKIYMIKIL